MDSISLKDNQQHLPWSLAQKELPNDDKNLQVTQSPLLLV
jgi:hypothetical protein